MGLEMHAFSFRMTLPPARPDVAARAAESDMQPPQSQSSKPEPGFMELGIDRLFMVMHFQWEF
jgi:hypothetical protein